MLKKILLTVLLSAVGSLVLLSCSKESPKLEYKVTNQKVASSNAIEFNTKVDILFVVDDSGSMDAHQADLVGNVSIFLDAIGRNRIVDYHIGVVTSSMDSFDDGGSVSTGGRLVQKQNAPAFIANSTKNGLFILKNYLRVGTSGSSTEKFFEPVQAALTPPISTQENAGFLRDDATLAVIYITDAEDQSNDPNTGLSYAAADFVSFLVNLKKGDAKKAILYGLIIPTSQVTSSKCQRDDGTPPKKIEAAITATKGHEYNLCDTNYNANLGALGRDIVSRVAVVHLDRRPDPSTITVKYGEKVIPNDVTEGWTYNPEDNTIVFGEDLIRALNGTADSLSIDFTAVPSAELPTPAP